MARFVAQAEIESCISSGYQLLENYAATTPRDTVMKRFIDGSETESIFTTTIVVNEDPGGDLKRVSVEVSYAENGQTSSLTLYTSLFWSSR